MSDSTTEITTIEQGDAALFASQNAAVGDVSPYDVFGDSSADSDTEDPVTRGQRTLNSLPMYRAVVPPHARRGKSKVGAHGPTGQIPNLTPGARRIP